MSVMNARLELMRLRNMALADALDIPIDELKKIDADEGVDCDQAANALRQSLREATAREVRAARTSVAQRRAPSANRARPPFEALKALVQQVFAHQPELKLAFRDGKKQSEQDWTSLYDDLVDMGAIDPNAD
jgi:hypothetical protein